MPLYASPPAPVVFLRALCIGCGPRRALHHEISRPANHHHRSDQPGAHPLPLLRLRRRRRKASAPIHAMCARPDHITAQKRPRSKLVAHLLNYVGLAKHFVDAKFLFAFIRRVAVVDISSSYVASYSYSRTRSRRRRRLFPAVSPGCAWRRHWSTGVECQLTSYNNRVSHK